jgi:hypothetical protein
MVKVPGKMISEVSCCVFCGSALGLVLVSTAALVITLGCDHCLSPECEGSVA